MDESRALTICVDYEHSKENEYYDRWLQSARSPL